MKLFRLRDGNYRNQKFNGSALLPIALVLACFAISPMAQAVVPAPDGGYPGGNTAEGQRALLNLTTGQFNSALGFLSLSVLTAGNFCTGVGAGALLLNTADGNTAVGAAALLSNTIGTGNTATGLSALGNNMDGIRNTANGVYALNHNVSGGGNTAIGYQALVNNTASGNTATGNDSLVLNTTGAQNTANGNGALASNTTGNANTAIGFSALLSNTTSNNNTAIGWSALASSTGFGNSGNNTAIGRGALSNNTTGNNNTALGTAAGDGVFTADNVICIGNLGADISNSCFIGNIHGVTTGIFDAIPVLIDSDGQLGTANSSRRFKKEIKPMDRASESILALKPVTFRYKSDRTSTPQFGLIAEEVAAVNPDLIIVDKEGKPLTVRYEQINAMLLNEFLKEHKAFIEEQRKVQEQEAAITQLKQDCQSRLAHQQKQIEALTAGLQKVSAQLELTTAAPQTVRNTD